MGGLSAVTTRWKRRRLERLVGRMWLEGRMQPAEGSRRDGDDGLSGVREPRRPHPPEGHHSADLPEG